MAVSTAKEIVLLKMPELAGPPEDARIDDMITLAEFYTAERIFMTRYQYALALVALHMLMLDKQSGGNSSSSGSGATGGINMEKEGELARKYGFGSGISVTVSEGKLYWMSTPFGQELLTLYNACILMPRTRFISGR